MNENVTRALKDIMTVVIQFDMEWKKSEASVTVLQREWHHEKLQCHVSQMCRDWLVVLEFTKDASVGPDGGVNRTQLVTVEGHMKDRIDKLDTYDSAVVRPKVKPAPKKPKKKAPVMMQDIPGVAYEAAPSTAVDPMHLKDQLEPFFAEIRSAIESQAGHMADMASKTDATLEAVQSHQEIAEATTARMEAVEGAQLQQADAVSRMELQFQNQNTLLESLAAQLSRQAEVSAAIMDRLQMIQANVERGGGQVSPSRVFSSDQTRLLLSDLSAGTTEVPHGFGRQKEK